MQPHHIKVVFIFFTILFLGFASCSEKTVNSNNDEPEDEISGTYVLEGYQVTLELCYASDCGGKDILSRDTLTTSFTVEIETVSNRPDSLLFSNLEGADVAINHPNYSGHAADENCNSGSAPDYCPYALIQNDTLEFNIITQPGAYTGTGTLKDEVLILETQFRHRGAGVDYFLSGLKTDS